MSDCTICGDVDCDGTQRLAVYDEHHGYRIETLAAHDRAVRTAVLEEAKFALRRWLKHTRACTYWRGESYGCTCGLDAKLRELKGDREAG